MTTRTFTGKGGRVVQSPYADDVAVAKLRSYVEAKELSGEFPTSLAQRSYHSANQMAWVHILVCEHERSEDGLQRGTSVALPDMGKVRALFAAAAAAGLQRPRVRMQVPDTGRIVLAVAGPSSKYAGDIMCTDGGDYSERRFYGRISSKAPDAGPDVLHAGAACTPGVVCALVELALDPVTTATTYGRVTGSCCFCGSDLTDGRSIAVGYGPVCAENFGLPWGAVSVPTTETLYSNDDNNQQQVQQ